MKRSAQHVSPQRLSQVRRGQQATIRGFEAGFPPTRQAHLLAYGLTPGTRVRVLQHKPVTIIQIENLEVAIERALADGIQVG